MQSYKQPCTLTLPVPYHGDLQATIHLHCLHSTMETYKERCMRLLCLYYTMQSYMQPFTLTLPILYHGVLPANMYACISCTIPCRLTSNHTLTLPALYHGDVQWTMYTLTLPILDHGVLQATVYAYIASTIPWSLKPWSPTRLKSNCNQYTDLVVKWSCKICYQIMAAILGLIWEKISRISTISYDIVRSVTIKYNGSGNGHDHLPITSDFHTNMLD